MADLEFPEYFTSFVRNFQIAVVTSDRCAQYQECIDKMNLRLQSADPDDRLSLQKRIRILEMNLSYIRTTFMDVDEFQARIESLHTALMSSDTTDDLENVKFRIHMYKTLIEHTPECKAFFKEMLADLKEKNPTKYEAAKEYECDFDDVATFIECLSHEQSLLGV